MSILHITEYSQMASDRVTHDVPAPQEPANKRQKLLIGSEVERSDPFISITTFVRLFAKADCKVHFGQGLHTDPAEFDPISSHTEVFRGVNPGDSVFVIEDSE